MKEKILISACLLGTPCRYDGASKPCEKAKDLKETYELIPICPEVMGGLETPRLPCEIKNGNVIRCDGADLSESYQSGAKQCLKIAQENKITLAILKEKSPSCGSHFRYDGTFSGTLISGKGITAELLTNNGIQVKSENEI